MRMEDGSGRVVWLWGPLLLVAVLVLVFQLDATDGIDSETVEPGSAHSAGLSPGIARATPMSGGEAQAPGSVFPPVPGYPPAPYAAGPAPWPGAGACPPWAMYGWPPSFPRPGDRSGRYWGSGAAEWGPPLGEYGPEAQVDPYWWVAAEEVDQ